ncbi:MAG: hypothetical protein FJX68_07265 [Alphaproteobacteria bacterium]|nr:hypothetical protein [Alphaproteobacteria bacterium]
MAKISYPDDGGKGEVWRYLTPAKHARPAHHTAAEKRALSAHLRQHLGPIKDVLHQLVSSHVHVDIMMVDRPSSGPSARWSPAA